ncbi:MAG: NADH-quinone oxidoreductase subunit C [Elusimicrobia bacterium]|nr:NADH-quinone oxidoreductase subunit C [Elusimicrobiota bacterium]
MTPEEVLKQVQREFPQIQRIGGETPHPEEVRGYLTLRVSSQDMFGLCKLLKEKLGFIYLDMITAVDWKGPVDPRGYITDPNPNPFLPEGATPQMAPSNPTPGVNYRETIQMVYLMTSLEKRAKIFLKVDLSRTSPKVSSLISLFHAADWQEREVYDLLGIQFEGHPWLKKILTPDFIAGNPLRKDYVHQKDRFD